nr:MAG TPA: hypothetical protein [Caudoviricetes sp.]
MLLSNSMQKMNKLSWIKRRGGNEWLHFQTI